MSFCDINRGKLGISIFPLTFLDIYGWKCFPMNVSSNSWYFKGPSSPNYKLGTLDIIEKKYYEVHINAKKNINTYINNHLITKFFYSCSQQIKMIPIPKRKCNLFLNIENMYVKFKSDKKHHPKQHN